MKKFLVCFTGILSIFACLIFGGCQKNSTETYVQTSFEEYTNNLFLSEITANTLNLHYTLADPKAFGIEDYPVTLGRISSDNALTAQSSQENMAYMLNTFSYDLLSDSQKLTWDILSDYLQTKYPAAGLTLYYEPLSPNSGMQNELPVLLAEYTFRTEQDISDYLVLLTDIPGYFDSIMEFEKEKAAAGLFMPDESLDSVISQCRDFSAGKENCFLVSSFNSRIDSFPGLNQTTKENFKASNLELILQLVLPAYDELTTELETLRGSGINDMGLCYYPQGKDYYEYLVKSSTGSNDSIPELECRTAAKREEDLALITETLAKDSALSGDSALSESSAVCSLDLSSPENILLHLKSAMAEEFPASASTNFTVKYVDPAMEPYMAPAFYLSTPLDDTTNNSIYINRGSSYSQIKLFTTLAHEGYPGHLYQNLMTASYGIDPVREILGFPGFTEGWATYVEMRSYHYAGLEEELAELLSKNQSATLSLYATLDMGIHYDGWSIKDCTEFLSEYGITDKTAALDIFQAIVCDPANYLKYYIGYLEFLDLKSYAMDSFGSSYNDKDFHEAILKMGPAPFHILEKHLPRFYNVPYIAD